MTDKFRFRKHATIGASAAEDDEVFLAECFVDTGDLSALIDCKDPRRIVLGRTGAGKTALVNTLADKKDAIIINPESLSFNYITNSTILKFFLDAGVKLDIFFKLLWRHVFTIELLKKKYNIVNEPAKKTFLERIKTILQRDKDKERAVEYILKWEDKFWHDTEYRIKEIASRVEKDLKISIGTKFSIASISASGGIKLTEEEKKEVAQHGQTIIDSIHIKELSDILDFLNEDIFNDEQRNYYICIDRLDENWVDDKFRFLLIRSLIETVRDFKKVRNIKIIVVLRNDLIERVFRLTRDPGFQEEKYRSLFLPIKWTDTLLKKLLDKRVNFLVKQSFTKKEVGYKDLLPRYVSDKLSAVDFMIERTLRRPRELIEFFNNCIEKSEGKITIQKTTLLAAEGDYSRNRLRSLQDEWFADHPSLIDFTFLLKKQQKNFKIGDLGKKLIEDFCLNYIIEHPERNDKLSLYAKDIIEDNMTVDMFLSFIFSVFYRTGIVGLKTETFESFQWSYIDEAIINTQSIDMNTRASVHPAFLRVLGLK